MKQIIISKGRSGVVEVYIPGNPVVKITDPEKLHLFRGCFSKQHLLEYEGVIIAQSGRRRELDALKDYILCLLKG